MGRRRMDVLTMRPATVEDTELLWKIQRVVLGDYVSEQFGTSTEQQRDFFDKHFAVTRHMVVVLDDVDIGYFFQQTRGDHVYLGNVALLPPYQGLGLGTRLVRETIADAGRSGLPVKLKVLKSNPRASALYERLGFTSAGETDDHVIMTTARPS